MPYKVTLPDSAGGGEFTTDDLTLDEVAAIEDALTVHLGDGAVRTFSWRTINPFREAKHAKVILEAFAARTSADARDQVGKMTVKQALDAISVVDDDLPDEYSDGLPDPKAPAPPTGGSSGAPNDSDGHPT